MSEVYRIIEDDLTGDEVLALLRLHLAEVRSWSPAASVHALPVERLRQNDVTFWSAWHGNQIASCGALKQLDASHGEVKAMRAHPDYRGKGAGRAMLEHIIAEARARGYVRLSLETGAIDKFIPARRLYQRHLFVECGPFEGYSEDPFSCFMTREL